MFIQKRYEPERIYIYTLWYEPIKTNEKIQTYIVDFDEVRAQDSRPGEYCALPCARPWLRPGRRRVGLAENWHIYQYDNAKFV